MNGLLNIVPIFILFVAFGPAIFATPGAKGGAPGPQCGPFSSCKNPYTLLSGDSCEKKESMLNAVQKWFGCGKYDTKLIGSLLNAEGEPVSAAVMVRIGRAAYCQLCCILFIKDPCKQLMVENAICHKASA